MTACDIADRLILPDLGADFIVRVGVACLATVLAALDFADFEERGLVNIFAPRLAVAFPGFFDDVI